MERGLGQELIAHPDRETVCQTSQKGMINEHRGRGRRRMRHRKGRVHRQLIKARKGRAGEVMLARYVKLPGRAVSNPRVRKPQKPEVWKEPNAPSLWAEKELSE